MNDLAQIHSANAKAILSNLPAALARGCHAVVEYAGLHAVGCGLFSGEGAFERAQAKLAELNASGDSTHGELHEPTGPSLVDDNGGGSSCLHSGINDDHLAARLGSAA